MGGVIIISLSICYIFGIWPNIDGLSCSGFFFFSLGAYLGIKKPYNTIDYITKLNWSIILFLIICIVDTTIFQYCNKGIIYQIEHAICTMIGIVAWFSVARKYSRKNNKLPIFLTKSTFFVYAFHGLISNLIKKFIVLIFEPSTNISWTIDYLIVFILILGLSLFAYFVCQLVLPKVTTILTGGR